MSIKQKVAIGFITVFSIILGSILCFLPEPVPAILSRVSSVLAVVSVALGLYSIHQANDGTKKTNEIAQTANEAVAKMNQSIEANNEVLDKITGIMSGLTDVQDKQDDLLQLQESILNAQKTIIVKLGQMKSAQTNLNDPPQTNPDQEVKMLVTATGDKIPWPSEKAWSATDKSK